MASINQIVSQIAHSVQGADIVAVRRALRLNIIQVRNSLIRHSYEKHGYIDRSLQQRFRVNLKNVPDGDLYLNSVSSGLNVSYIKRSINKVPRPTRLTNNLPFSAVRTAGVENPVEIAFVREPSSKFYKSLPGFCPVVTYDYINDYLYINTINDYNFKNIGAVIIEAPFEVPEDVLMETNESTYKISDDDEYFLPEDMVTDLVKLILSNFNIQVARNTDEVPVTNLSK